MAKFINPNKKQEKKPSKIGGAYAKLKQKLSFLKWIDPFTYVDLFVIPHVKKVTDSEIVEFIVNAAFAFVFAWIIYTALGIIFGSSSPLVIVYSASMEPTFFRGDVMALSKANASDNFGAEVTLPRPINGVGVYDFVQPSYSSGQLTSLYFSDINVSITPNTSGNVVVYNSRPMNLPIIHRAIAKIHAPDGDYLLTKGDNSVTNYTFDQDCGAVSNGVAQRPCVTYYAVPLKEVVGKTFFIIPKVGCVKLWLLDDFASILATGNLPRDFKGIC
jgi:signal peptidase I